MKSLFYQHELIHVWLLLLHYIFTQKAECVTLEGKIKDNTMIIENPTITSGSKVIYILYKK